MNAIAFYTLYEQPYKLNQEKKLELIIIMHRAALREFCTVVQMLAKFQQWTVPDAHISQRNEKCNLQ